MSSVRFVMVGGFLGAGKTTTLARLARDYMARGLRVGLVTNDQAQDLVDTNSLRAQGFPVQEVPGACFCCKFDELVSRAGDLQAAERPDVILLDALPRLVTEILLRGQERGEFSKRIDARLAAASFLATAGAIVSGQVFGKDDLTPAEINRQFLQLTFSGLNPSGEAES